MTAVYIVLNINNVTVVISAMLKTGNAVLSMVIVHQVIASRLAQVLKICFVLPPTKVEGEVMLGDRVV